MTKIVKNGTVVTADRTWKADVLFENEKITAIGEDLTGDETIDATDAHAFSSEQRLTASAATR